MYIYNLYLNDDEFIYIYTVYIYNFYLNDDELYIYNLYLNA